MTRFALLAALVLGTPAAAETVYALSDAEVAKIVPAPVTEREASVADAPAPRDRHVHGEMTMGIGTGGYRSLGGSAVVPLSSNAWAAMAFETGQYGRRVYRHR